MTWLQNLILLILYTGFCYAVWGLITELRRARKPPVDWKPLRPRK